MKCPSTNSDVYRGLDSLPILLDRPQICYFFLTEFHIFLFLWINTIFLSHILSRYVDYSPAVLGPSESYQMYCASWP